jgi:hypothetical protein
MPRHTGTMPSVAYHACTAAIADVIWLDGVWSVHILNIIRAVSQPPLSSVEKWSVVVSGIPIPPDLKLTPSRSRSTRLSETSRRVDSKVEHGSSG